MHAANKRGATYLVDALLLSAGLIACGGSNSTPMSPTTGGGLNIPASLPAGVTASMVNDGKTLFDGGSCPSCHGPGGHNGPYGPNLTDSVFLHNSGLYDEIIAVITSGIPASQFKSPTSNPSFFMLPKGAMTLSDTQLRALAAYVWFLSHPGGCTGTRC